MLTEAAFGVLPAFVAGRRGAAAPATRWDIWLLLNAGLVVLLAGMPSINGTLIIAGGTLIFTVVTLLILQLRSIGGGQTEGSGSLKFYLMGLVYLLVGILIGTGLWVGWSERLRIGLPKEAHIHANSWGFAALIFAGRSRLGNRCHHAECAATGGTGSSPGCLNSSQPAVVQARA